MLNKASRVHIQTCLEQIALLTRSINLALSTADEIDQRLVDTESDSVIPRKASPAPVSAAEIDEKLKTYFDTASAGITDLPESEGEA